MGIVRLNCPYCRLEQSACETKSQRKWERYQRNYMQIVVECGGCHNWTLLRGLLNYGMEEVEAVKADYELNVENIFEKFTVDPRPESTEAPEFTPEQPGKSYSQAMKALARGDWDAAGMMARKALETSTGILDRNFTRADGLKKRIDTLAAAHAITPGLQEWAHAIRDTGNDAAHDDFTEEEAKEICSFAKTFMEFVFTLPGRLAQRQAEFTGDGADR